MLLPADAMALVELLDALNNEARVALLSRYCQGCGEIQEDEEGRADPCQCRREDRD